MIIAAAFFAPRMKLVLLSSRIVGRCALLPDDVNACPVNQMRGPMTDAVNKAVDAFALGQDIWGDITRFQTPAPLDKPILPKAPLAPLPYSRTAMEWGRHYNAQWIRYVRQQESSPLRVLLVVKNADGDSELFLTPHIHGWSGHLLRCQVSALQHGMIRPFQYQQSEFVSAAMHAHRTLALPFFSWTVSPEQERLLDESFLGNLAPWTPPKKKAALPAIADGVADDHEDAEERAEDGAEQEEEDKEDGGGRGREEGGCRRA